MTQQLAWVDEVLGRLKAQMGWARIECLKDISGRSLAKTLLVRVGTGVGVHDFILKMGPLDAINVERDRSRIALRHFHDTNHIVAVLQQTDGFEHGALVLEVRREGGATAPTFEEFYRDAQPAQCAAAINTLFKEVLRVHDAVIAPDPRSAFAMYTFDDPVRLSSELRKVGDSTPTLIDWWQHAACTVFPPGRASIAHGDLHSKNVLMVRGHPVLIDFGRTDEKHHALRDLAKLAREVMLVLFAGKRDDPTAALTALRDEFEGRGSPSAAQDVELEKAVAAVKTIHKIAKSVGGHHWAREYKIALMAQFVFAAASPNFDCSEGGDPYRVRIAALGAADALRRELEEEHPAPGLSPVENRKHQRTEFLWKLAYVVLRLDQLPGGGWGRSLPRWMEALWAGDSGEVERHSSMRREGGTDLTAYGVFAYLSFIGSAVQGQEDFPNNDVLSRAERALRAKIGPEGSISTGHRGADRPLPAIQLRHTLLGLVTFLRIALAKKVQPLELKPLMAYLLENHHRWAQDASHPFATYAGAVKVFDLLEGDWCDAWDGELPELRQNLKAAIEASLPKLSEALLAPARYQALPRGTYDHESRESTFRPYGSFWRMERSNLLMYVPLLVVENGSRISSKVSAGMQQRCRDALLELIREISPKFRPSTPELSLLPYHEGSHGVQAPRDWGLSAELAAVLRIPGIRDLLEAHWTRAGIGDRLASLQEALVATFDCQRERPGLFTFMHGSSFARYLAATDDRVSADEIKNLDELVGKCEAAGVTEFGLHRLLKALTPRGAHAKLIKFDAILDFLVDRFESGEHVPDQQLCAPEAWKQLLARALATTIKFYDGRGGTRYGKRYQEPVAQLVARLQHFPQLVRTNGRRGGASALDRSGLDGPRIKVLDVGCGPGQYAVLLNKEFGASVELWDASEQMLKIAAAALGVPPPAPREFQELRKVPAGSYDLVFACAMMVHVPVGDALDTLRQFYRILKPQGVLFVNFKIGDHSLISRDERFFAYYRDAAVPEEMLRAAGFEIDSTALRWNHQNMYRASKAIRWANIYCVKP